MQCATGEVDKFPGSRKITSVLGMCIPTDEFERTKTEPKALFNA